MAVFSELGMLIEYDKKTLRPFSPFRPPPPTPSVDEQVAAILEKWPPLTKYPKPTDAILTAASRFFHRPKREIIGRCQQWDIAHERHVIMYLLRTLAAMSFPQIGLFLKRDHTSVMHGYRKVRDEIAAGDVQVEANVAAVRARAIKINPVLGEDNEHADQD